MLLSRQKVENIIEIRAENFPLIKEVSLRILDVVTLLEISLLGIVILGLMNRGYQKYKRKVKIKSNLR